MCVDARGDHTRSLLQLHVNRVARKWTTAVWPPDVPVTYGEEFTVDQLLIHIEKHEHEVSEHTFKAVAAMGTFEMGWATVTK